MIRYDGQTGYAYDGHRGTDFAIVADTPVVAADDGTVTYAEWSDSGGWGVVLEHAGNRTAYFHNNALFVYPGQRVSRGQLIALSGSTGNSTGPHVHFEVRDLLPFWHAIDPFGWTGPGRDPWRFDQGYLWTSDPPTPFVLPLVFPSGARWNAWYGRASDPPPIRWRIQDGLWGFDGARMAWDEDPGGPAPGAQAGRSGSTQVPGPGRHTLHWRVFDRAGHTADIAYLYLYDRGEPLIRLESRPPGAPLVTLRWSARDALSGPQGFRSEVQADGGDWRAWFDLLAAEDSGAATGSAVLIAQAGHRYAVRTVALNRAGNISDPVGYETAVATDATPISVADALTVPLPGAPPASTTWSLARAEVRNPRGPGAYLLDAWGGILPLGGAPLLPSPGYEPGVEWAVDLLLLPEGGGYIVGTDGRLTPVGDAPALEGPPLPGGSRGVRGALVAGGAIVVDAAGSFVAAARSGATLTPPELAESLTPGSHVIDVALLGATRGLVLDSAGKVHAFAARGAAAPAAEGFPPEWPLSAPPRALVVGPSGAGYLLAADGTRVAVGSLLRFDASLWSGPWWDGRLGLPIRPPG